MKTISYTLICMIYSILTFAPLSEAGSFSKPPKEPTPAPQPAPSPSPNPAPSEPVDDSGGSTNPQAPRDPASVSGVDFISIGHEVATQVDAQFPNYRELMIQRAPASNHSSDRCHSDLDLETRFADQISYFVDQGVSPQRPQVQSITSYYGTSNSVSQHEPVSLIRHPMCAVSASTLSETLASGKVPSESVIKKLNEFARQYNQARAQWIGGDQEGLIKVEKLWNRLFSCLAYEESMTSADTKKSDAVSDKYSPSGYRRPKGVLFYEDPAQDQASKLNIGVFQFTPNSGGNIQSCLKSWNQLYPSCSLNEKGSQGEMIRLTGSGYQNFNSFCGINKVLQTFALQVNTTKSSVTHPNNRVSGKLKKPADRCVSLHFAAGKAYNHFGPFQNSTKTNLNSLFTCALKN